jgi:hypothetical protein
LSFQRTPLTQWLELKIQELQDSFKILHQAVKFPFAWPLESNGSHAPVLEPIEHQLAAISLHYHSHYQIRPIDPWLQPFSPADAASIADGILGLLSSDLISEAPPLAFAIRATYILSRILVFVLGFLDNHGNILNLYPMDDLMHFREALLKMVDAHSLLKAFAVKISQPAHKSAFLAQHDFVLDKVVLSKEVIELSITLIQGFFDSESPEQSTMRPANAETNSAPPTQSQGEYASQFITVCEDLAKKATKAASLAQDRLRTVTPQVVLIARAQLKALHANISKFQAFCTLHRTRLQDAPLSSKVENASTALQRLSLQIADSLSAISRAEESIPNAAGVNAPQLSPQRSTKTPKKANVAASKSNKAILSPRELAQHRTIVSYFGEIGSIADKLDLGTDKTAEGTAILLQEDLHEASIRLLERQHRSEEDLHALISAERKRKKSTTSRFLAEAFAMDAQGSSQSSIPDLPEHESDKEFIQSQESEFAEQRHPRFLLSRDLIQQNLYIDKAPAVTSRFHVNDLPPGWCPKGHRIKYRPSSKKKDGFKCSSCNKQCTTNIFTCHCSEYFICSSCLTEHKACPAPPNCPKLDCIGTCTLRYKPLITQCYEGKHDIERNQLAWMCSDSKCRTIICRDCATSTEAQLPANTGATAEDPQPTTSTRTAIATAAPLPQATDTANQAASVHAASPPQAADSATQDAALFDIAADVQHFLSALDSQRHNTSSTLPPQPCSQQHPQDIGQSAPMRNSGGQ